MTLTDLRFSRLRVVRVDVDDLPSQTGSLSRRRKLPAGFVGVAKSQELILGPLNDGNAFGGRADEAIFADDLDEVPSGDEVQPNALEEVDQVRQSQ